MPPEVCMGIGIPIGVGMRFLWESTGNPVGMGGRLGVDVGLLIGMGMGIITWEWEWYIVCAFKKSCFAQHHA